MLKYTPKCFVQRNFPLFLHPVYKQARMAELVDALDSKSSNSNVVWVRFPLRVPRNPLTNQMVKGFSIFRETTLFFYSPFSENEFLYQFRQTSK